MFLSSKNQVEFTVANRTIIRIILIVVATILGLKLISSLAHVLTLIFVSIFLAIALNPAVRNVSRHLRIKSRVAATAVAYIMVLFILVVFLSLIIPPLVRQTTDFVGNLPQTIDTFRTQDSSLARFIRAHKLDTELSQVTSELRNHIKDLPEPVLATAGRITGTLVSVITVLVMTFMMLVEGPTWLERFWQLQPPDKRKQRIAVARRMYKVVTGYVNGQLLIALIAALFALVALMIASTALGVSINAVGLAGIIALMGLVPMIGNTIGAVIVVVLCLFSSLPLAIIMGIFFLVYQQIENATLQPYIQSKTNELTPLLVFIAAIVGVAAAGILGALIAIPLAGCIKIFLEEWLGDRLPQGSTTAKVSN